MKGAFIAIEGIDGCGKGTIIKRLTADLYDADKNHHIFLTREPFRRDWLKSFLSTIDPNSRPLEATAYFVKDRLEHCKVFEPMLKKGVIVLSDRYKLSTYAYQMAQGAPFEKIHELHKDVAVPDLTIVIDITADESAKRISAGREQTNAFQDPSFLAKVRDNYLSVKDRLKEKIVVVNGARDRDAVYADVKKLVLDFLKNR